MIWQQLNDPMDKTHEVWYIDLEPILAEISTGKSKNKVTLNVYENDHKKATKKYSSLVAAQKAGEKMLKNSLLEKIEYLKKQASTLRG